MGFGRRRRGVFRKTLYGGGLPCQTAFSAERIKAVVLDQHEIKF